jgi:hypothetical protein
MDVYLHSPIHLYGVVSSKEPGRTLPHSVLKVIKTATMQVFEKLCLAICR